MAGVMVALNYMGHVGQVSVDQQRARTRMLWAVISNGQLYGRVLRFAPQAKMDDGLLNLTVLEGYGILSTVRHLASLALGQYARDPTMHQYEGKSIAIHTRRPLPVHVDAEPMGTTPVQIDVVPQALTVVLPNQLPRHLLSGMDGRQAPGLFAAWTQTSDEIAQRVRAHVALRVSDILRGPPPRDRIPRPMRKLIERSQPDSSPYPGRPAVVRRCSRL